MSEMPEMSALFSLLSQNNSPKSEELFHLLMNASTPKNDAKTQSDANDSESETTTASSNSDNMPDMEWILKLVQVMKASQQDSPSKELLQSLKPFLSDSRKEKVDQYIKILGMTKALEIFQELGDSPK